MYASRTVGMSRKRRFRDKQNAKSFLKHISSRERGNLRRITVDSVPDSFFRLLRVWNQQKVDIGFRNKIFASQWLTANHVIYGTRCNDLVLHDFSTDDSVEIPLIGNDNTIPADNASTYGIHSIQINPSQCLLATGGHNVNDIGVYKLNEISPYSLLHGFHKDCVFDLRWLDDSCLASCSRDSSLALWNIPADADGALSGVNLTSNIHRPSPSNKLPHSTSRPMANVSSFVPDDRFRSLEYLANRNIIAVVSLSRHLYLYDAVRIGQEANTRPVFALSLRDAYQEAVALRRWPNHPNCVALATHHCVLLFDIRCANPVKTSGRCVHPRMTVSGIRSLNFAGNVLSYGTSTGQVHFYDLRGNERLPLHLDVGPGWVKPIVCDDPATSTSVSVANDFTPHSPNRSEQRYDRTVMINIDNLVNLPSVQVLPQNPSILPPWAYSNGGLPLPTRPQRSGNNLMVAGSPQDSRHTVTSQVSNLRVRLDRIQHMLEDIRDRGNRMRSRVSLPVSDMILDELMSSEQLTNTRVGGDISGEQEESEDPANSLEDNVLDPRVSMFSGDLEAGEEENADWTSGDAQAQEPTGEEEFFLFTRPRQHRVRNNLRTNTSFRRTSGSVLWRFPSLTNFSRFISPDFFFPLADLYPNLTSYPTLTNQRSMPAIFTHEYDPSGTRLFTAGGPITSSCYGNVASLWE